MRRLPIRRGGASYVRCTRDGIETWRLTVTREYTVGQVCHPICRQGVLKNTVPPNFCGPGVPACARCRFMWPHVFVPQRTTCCSQSRKTAFLSSSRQRLNPIPSFADMWTVAVSLHPGFAASQNLGRVALALLFRAFDLSVSG